MTLALERKHWEGHTKPYLFYDENEYRLILSLLALQDPGERRVLEIGCGSGVWTKNLARLGVKVFHFDLADTIVKEARQNAIPYPVHGFVADMHFLPFPDASFDAVFGSMVLHHSEDHLGFGKEVARVLRPARRAVFHENSGRNPILIFFRRWLVGRFGIPRNSSPGEHPLQPQEIEDFSQAFDYKKIHIGRLVFLQLACKYLLHTEQGLFFQIAHWLDDKVYRFFPGLRWMSYYQILEFQALARPEAKR